MLKNYFKIAFRNLIKFKVYSFVNIAGLEFIKAAWANPVKSLRHE